MERWPGLLVWVLEDQSRGVPHLHYVVGHTTKLEKAFAGEFFRALKPAAYMQGLGHTSTYEKAVMEQGKYEAGRLRRYVTKLARYLAKGEGAGEFLRRHSGRAGVLRGSLAERPVGRDHDDRATFTASMGGSKGLHRYAGND